MFGEKPYDNLFVSTNTIFVDDKLGFPDRMTLDEILAEMARFYPNWDKKLASRLFTHFEFNKRSYHHHLSKGKIATFNMIVGLATHAALTIFDEPTTGMDAAVRKDFYRALLRDYLAHPRTILVSSHHLNEIEDLLEDVILIDRGELALHVSMDELREYATGVVGPSEKIRAWAKNQPVLYEEKVGIDDLYVAIKGQISEEEVEVKGFRRLSVSPTDVAVYVTRSGKGGIDDVFDDE